MSDTYFLSNSEAQTWKRCRRKWWLTYYRKLKPRFTDLAGKAASGTRVHETLSHWYSPDRPDDLNLLDVLSFYIARDRKLIHSEMIGEQIATDSDLYRSRMGEYQTTVSYERAMIEGYSQWLEESGIDAELEVVSAETPMISHYSTVHIPGTHDRYIDVYIIGIVDAVVHRILDGKLLFIDHKTTASLSQPLQTIHMNEQILHYMLLMPNRASSALWNLIKRVKRTGRAIPPFFDRVQVSHSKLELNSYMSHLNGVIDDILRAKLDLDKAFDHHRVVYPSVRQECTWDCPFFSVCHMLDDGSHAEPFISAKYVQGDPLERYKNAHIIGAGIDD